MDDTLNVSHLLVEKLHFICKMNNGTPWHANTHVECGRMNVPEGVMQGALVWLAQHGYVRLTTWCNVLRRETHYFEFATPDLFFHNRDDGNYVRVMPLVQF